MVDSCMLLHVCEAHSHLFAVLFTNTVLPTLLKTPHAGQPCAPTRAAALLVSKLRTVHHMLLSASSFEGESSDPIDQVAA